ncbi:glycosyltransferase family 4 protein [Nisaea sp.]|uniref:glycosyltransferase family 4 protein n=1 Tax=Nisaea sp. TaxID=2024842 RepID=UPI003B523708
MHAIGWFEGRFGYNVHTRNFFESLARLTPVVASPLIVNDGPWQADRALLERIPNLTPRATVALLYAEMMDILDGAPGRRIAYTVWESTVFPSAWIEKLRAADEVWIPSAWGREVLIENGLSAGTVHVVPEGVDPAIFNPDIAPTAALDAFSGFKFLNVGRFESRKGTQLLIETFDRAFGPNDDVRLILACDNHHDPDFNIARILRALNLRYPERIAFIPPVRSHARFAELYRACDAFVSPFRAEGWGLPVCEAMACGLPVIATDYSGPTEFMDESVYRIGCSVVEITDAQYLSAATAGGRWAEPDPDHLCELLREVYRNRNEAARRGLAGARHILDHFTWTDAANTALSRLSS